jgi:ATP-dependent RNA helicase DDX52/ROK1
VDAIHADMSVSARAASVDNFRAGETWFLIATDLMARGVDFVGVASILNLDFPSDPIAYIHRVGRTGRAGQV